MDFLHNLVSSFSSLEAAPSAGMMLLAMLAAFIAGQVVGWAYMWSHAGVSYSRTFVQSLVLVAVVVALVMIIVGTNVIVALGLFGAFAVIRFRNVLKDTRDTAFIFMELAVGLAAGTWNFTALGAGTAFFVLVTLYLSATRFGSMDASDALVHLRAAAAARDVAGDVLARHCQRQRLVSHHAGLSGDEGDFSWRVVMRDPARAEELLAELRGIDGVRDASVLFHVDQLEA